MLNGRRGRGPPLSICAGHLGEIYKLSDLCGFDRDVSGAFSQQESGKKSTDSTVLPYRIGNPYKGVKKFTVSFMATELRNNNDHRRKPKSILTHITSTLNIDRLQLLENDLDSILVILQTIGFV